jgi:4'-phosphopantetheinyl transferase
VSTDDFDWAEFDGKCILSSDEVHVWRATLDVSQSRIDRLYELLSPDERERAGRFRNEVDANRSIIGRGYLRLLLGRTNGLRSAELQFEYDEFGKPGLVAHQRSGLHFSVSHSGDQILLALAKNRAVGVDLERIRTDLDVNGLAERFFSASESKNLACLTGAALYHAFFACWSRKEAYVKAKGQGLSLPLDQFDLAFLPGEEPRLLATRPDPAEANRWKLVALNVAQNYAAALIAAGQDWKLRCWTLGKGRS